MYVELALSVRAYVCCTPRSSLGDDDLMEDFAEGLLLFSVHRLTAFHRNDLAGQEPLKYVCVVHKSKYADLNGAVCRIELHLAEQTWQEWNIIF